MSLNTDINITDHDSLYQILIDAHEGLSDEQSAKVNSRLVLLLANHIGDRKTIVEAIKIAASYEKAD